MYLPVTPAQVQEALENDPEIGVVYLTSPNMEGLVADYAAIRQACQPGNVLLIVDEAHGAHSYFNKAMPVGALKSGADVTVSSVHKTLGALSASALINVSKSSRLPASKVQDAYHLLNTTSPSPLLLADVESCVRTLKNDGGMIIDRAINLGKKLKDAMGHLPNVTVGAFEGFKSDPTKTVLKICGLTGHELSDILDSMRINIEKSTQKCIVITTHINITEEDVDKLISALVQISSELGPEEEASAIEGDAAADHQNLNPIYKKILINRRYKVDLRDCLAAESEMLPASDCLGRVSAEIRYKCPPGFPVLVYGEEILPEHIELFGATEKLKVMMRGCSSPTNQGSFSTASTVTATVSQASCSSTLAKPVPCASVSIIE
jgi:arginine/lysine/ornithine decarboxylase